MLRIQNIPLRVVLIVPFVLELMAAVGLTAYLAYRHTQDATNELADRLMVEASIRVKDHLESYLDVPVQITHDHVNAIELNLLSWKNGTTLEGYFWQRLQDSNRTQHPLGSLMLVDQRHNLVAVERVTSEGGLIHRRNEATKGQLRSYAVEPDGQRSRYEVQFDPQQDPLQEKSWYPTLNQSTEGRWQLISTPEVDSILRLERPSLSAIYLRPFHNSSHQVQGVVGASVDLAHISRYLQGLKISRQGQAFIVERSGDLVASSTGESILLPQPRKPTANPVGTSGNALNLPPRSRLAAIRSLDTTTKQATQFLLEQFGSLKQLTTDRPLSFERDGKHYFLQVTPLQNPQNLNWLLVVVIPQSDFAARLGRQYHVMFALSGFAVLGAIAVGLATAQRIARPIQRLSRASQDLMLGKLEAPVEERSRITELAVMAHSFNEMTEQLMQSFDQVKLALQESKEKFTTVFRNSPDPIMVSSLPEGKILEVNDSFLRLMGYSRQQVVNRTGLELELWSDLDARQEFMRELQAVGRVYNQELNALNQRGEMITALISSEAIELEGKTCLLTVSKDITERKRLEEALRRSEAKLQDVLNSVTAAICYFHMDETGVLQSDYLSAGTLAVFGYKPDVLLANSTIWRSRVHADDWQTVVEPCFAAAAQGRSRAIEYRYHHPNGNSCWIAAEVISRWDEKQNHWAVTTIEFDITARKQAAEALRLSEERFRTAFGTASIGMDIAALDGRLLEVNPALCQMLGYSETELLARNYQAITHPDDLAADQTANLKILSGQVPSLFFEKRFIHKDGQTIWTLLSLALVRNFYQQPLYWVAQVQDITDRKLAEASIRQSEARFRGVFNTATLGIAIADLHGRIIEANERLCQVLGYSCPELQQMQLIDLANPTDSQRWRDWVAEQQDQHQFRTRCLCKNGLILWVQISSFTIQDSAQYPLYLIVHIEVLPISTHPNNSLLLNQTELKSG